MAEGLGPGHCLAPREDDMTVLLTRCQADLAAQWVLIAGEALAKTVGPPAAGEKEYPLSEAEWRAWRAAFKRLADTVPDTAEWELKRDAGKAYEKMALDSNSHRPPYRDASC
ncbi:hypothetical protein OCS_01327 [Ophiocordyceps sinensis CO18]|uniref:Uncharacterized protein n=1 Tax=Ophiocordyceps sinensis (strain Co18 / CGMCC 3.14243) TaxID=911162 RepID=T5AKM1_OPHSC|nr:hypothetical protein OCS_01327 [Ophiocordyceps sinensis CO18]